MPRYGDSYINPLVTTVSVTHRLNRSSLAASAPDTAVANYLGERGELFPELSQDHAGPRALHDLIYPPAVISR